MHEATPAHGGTGGGGAGRGRGAVCSLGQGEQSPLGISHQLAHHQSQAFLMPDGFQQGNCLPICCLHLVGDAQADLVYAVATEDMDALTFGSPRLLRHLMASKTQNLPVVEFELSKALEVRGPHRK